MRGVKKKPIPKEAKSPKEANPQESCVCVTWQVCVCVTWQGCRLLADRDTHMTQLIMMTADRAAGLATPNQYLYLWCHG